MLANARGVLSVEEAEKATQFIQFANSSSTPFVFLQNTTGYMVGKQYEQDGITKDGAQMINAVSKSRVPHLTVVLGASYGAGNYGMCGRAFGPRFLFSWPGATSTVMGPAQLAGVLSLAGRQSAASRGLPYDEEQDAAMRRLVEAQIEAESLALANSAAPMPGTVLRVEVAAGDAVRESQVLLVLEAMKMEHAVRAAAGTVAQVAVAVRDQVDAGAVLVVAEPEA